MALTYPTQHSLLCNMIFPLPRRKTPCPPRHVLAPSYSLRALLLSSKNGNHKADRLAASISQALKDAGLNEGRSVKPSDMLRFGMGLGITLGANGLLGELGGGGETGAAVGGAGGGNSGRSRGWQGESIEITGGAEASLAPPVVKVGSLKQSWCKAREDLSSRVRGAASVAAGGCGRNTERKMGFLHALRRPTTQALDKTQLT